MKFTAVISIVISLQYYYGINTLIICDVRWVRCAIKMPYNAFDKLNYTLIFEWKMFHVKKHWFLYDYVLDFFLFIHFLLLLTTHHKLKRIEIQSPEYTQRIKNAMNWKRCFYFVLRNVGIQTAFRSRNYLINNTSVLPLKISHADYCN